MGLSLISGHIAAMEGPLNHKFFDPNILIIDEEMRKGIELLYSAYILTAQERPEGTQKHLREDLLKKLATAEGIMGRLP